MDEVQFYIEQLASDDFPQRRQAAEMLGEFGDHRGVKPLMKMLGDDHWQVRNTVIESLVKIKDKSSVTPLVACLRDEDPAVRNSAMSALNELGEDVVPPLVDLLLNDDSVDVRIFSANTLGNHGSTAIEGLVAALKDPQPNVRYAAAEALGMIGDENAAIPLIEALREEDVWDRFPYITSLGKIGDERACPTLIGFLEDEILSYPAVIALGQIGDVSGLYPVLHLLEKSDDPTILSACAGSLARMERKCASFSTVERQGYFHSRVTSALKKLDSPKLMDVLISMLTGGDEDEAHHALCLLGIVRGKVPVEKMIYLLADQVLDEDIRDLIIHQGHDAREAVAAALGSFTEKEILADLIRIMGVIGREEDAAMMEAFLDFPDTDIVCDTLKALGMLRSVSSFGKISGFLAHEDEEVRNSAVGAISLLPKKDITGDILTLARSEEELFRRGAYRIIGHMSNLEDVVGHLFRGLEDESGLVRAAAVRSLGYVGMSRKSMLDSEERFSAICRVLFDEETNVRVEALLALGRINHPGTHEFIKSLLDDNDSEVRRFAIRAIGRCAILDAVPKLCEMLSMEESIEDRLLICTALGLSGSRTAVPVLVDALDDHSPDVVAEAISALGRIGGEGVAEEILPYLESDNWLVQEAALCAFASLREPSVLPAVRGFLEKVWDDEDKKLVVRGGIKVLGKVGGNDCADIVLSALDRPDFRYEAFDALRDIWGRGGVTVVPSGISSHVTRRLAASALSFVSSGDSLDALKLMADDSHPSVRRAALLGLKFFDSPKSSETIVKKSKDPDPWVREIAAGNQESKGD